MLRPIVKDSKGTMAVIATDPDNWDDYYLILLSSSVDHKDGWKIRLKLEPHVMEVLGSYFARHTCIEDNTEID